MRRMRKARRTGGLPWYDADVDLVAAAQKFHGRDVLQHAAVIHILGAKAREAEALVDKVVFVFQPQVPLPDAWLPFDNLLRQGLHELGPARSADAGSDWQCI